MNNNEEISDTIICDKIKQLLTDETNKNSEKKYKKYKYIYHDIRSDHILRNVVIDARCKEESILKGYEIDDIDEELLTSIVIEHTEDISGNFDQDKENINHINEIKKIIMSGIYDVSILKDVVDFYFENDTLWIEQQK
jgi:hypothetical protein